MNKRNSFQKTIDRGSLMSRPSVLTGPFISSKRFAIFAPAIITGCLYNAIINILSRKNQIGTLKKQKVYMITGFFRKKIAVFS